MRRQDDQWTGDEEQLLIEMELAYTPREEMARRSGRTITSVNNRIQKLRHRALLPPARGVGSKYRGFLPRVLPSPQARFEDFVTEPGDWMVTGDYQIPCHDSELIEFMLDVAKVLRIERVCIPGDFLNCDAYSKFDKFVPEEKQKFGVELEVAGRVIESLLEQFKEVLILPGNHELRFLRQNEWNCSFEHLLRLFGLGDGYRSRIRVSTGGKTSAAYRYCVLSGYRVTHARNFSVIPVRVAWRLASVFEQDIICPHGHRLGKMMSESGKHIVIESGGMFDPARIDYCNAIDTTHPRQVPGFVSIRNGVAECYGNRKYTDWDFWRNVRIPRRKT